MKIILMNHHEALILEDGEKIVTVEPETDGILTVNGKAYTISCGGSAPVFNGEESPAARDSVWFEGQATEWGEKYILY